MVHTEIVASMIAFLALVLSWFVLPAERTPGLQLAQSEPLARSA